MTEGKKEKQYTFGDLKEIVRVLRSEQGCPWDRVQTHESLERCMIEEAYEAVEGIRLLAETGDGENLCEELGDVLLQVVFHGLLAEEEGIFSLEDVIRGICEKMIHRHPHVFGAGRASGQEIPNWEELKKQEKKGKRDQRSELEAIPMAFPALTRAAKLQKKLIKGGYCQEEAENVLWENAEARWAALKAEKPLTQEEAAGRIGDILYEICRISGTYGVDAEKALADKVRAEVEKYR